LYHPHTIYQTIALELQISDLSDLLIKQFYLGGQFPVTRLLMSDLTADYRIPKPD
jgi:hypothetical protein